MSIMFLVFFFLHRLKRKVWLYRLSKLNVSLSREQGQYFCSLAEFPTENDLPLSVWLLQLLIKLMLTALAQSSSAHSSMFPLYIIYLKCFCQKEFRIWVKHFDCKCNYLYYPQSDVDNSHFRGQNNVKFISWGMPYIWNLCVYPIRSRNWCWILS